MDKNPYFDTTFFEFFWVFLKRLTLLLTGQLPWNALAPDEVQVVVLCGVAAAAALVGCFLVLRRMTMLANAISHTILLGIVIAYVVLVHLAADVSGEEHGGVLSIKSLLIASLVMGVCTAFLTEFLTKTVRLQADASTGLVFTTLFALGVVLVTLLTRDAHIGTEAVMGNVDALHIDDCKLVLLILGLNVGVIFLFFKELKMTTFDPHLASALGFSAPFYNYLLMTLFSATAVVAFRAVGVLMVLAFLTGPVLTARLLTHDFKKLLFLAVGLGVVAAFCGVALSRHILTVTDQPLSTGGVTVSLITGIYFSVIGVKLLQNRIRKSSLSSFQNG
jgi:manganese/zinc/iron transport system permease protein